MNEIEQYTHDDNLLDIIGDFDNIVFDSDCDFWDVGDFDFFEDDEGE